MSWAAELLKHQDSCFNGEWKKISEKEIQCVNCHLVISASIKEESQLCYISTLLNQINIQHNSEIFSLDEILWRQTHEIIDLRNRLIKAVEGR